jgi:SAM-dependent methyltransferase
VAEIEQRIESTIQTPDYASRQFGKKAIERGAHRKFIGANWETHGLRQLEFLKEQGLQPGHRFLDVGCGSLRAGRHLIDYLEPGHYYGIDANLGLLQAGYDVELTDEQRERMPAANLRANDRFDGDFGVKFDMAIAQSVYTHVSLNHVRLSLFRVAKVMRPGGKFFTTFNEQAATVPVDAIIERPERQPQFTERNLFWYYRGDLEWAGRIGPWRYRYIGGWGHPGGQKMVEFTRLADKDWAGTRPAAARARADAPKPFAHELRKRIWKARKRTAGWIAPQG